MVIFLTSNIGGIKKVGNKKVPEKFTNSNGFLNNMKKHIKRNNKFVLIASNPDSYEKNDIYLNMDIKALDLSGIKFKEYVVLDNRNKNDIFKVLNNASLIFLCGGNTYEQNKFFNDIKLKDYIKDIDACIVGISAGSINSAEDVFNSPESEDDLNNPSNLKGLGITSFNIEPHFKNRDNKIQMDSIIKESYNRVIYGIPDGTYILQDTIYGECFKIYNGEIQKICQNNNIFKVT